MELGFKLKACPDRLRRLRKRKRLTQKEMCKRLGLKHNSTWQRWESGHRSPSQACLDNIASEFNVDVISLLPLSIFRDIADAYWLLVRDVKAFPSADVLRILRLRSAGKKLLKISDDKALDSMTRTVLRYGGLTSRRCRFPSLPDFYYEDGPCRVNIGAELLKETM